MSQISQFLTFIFVFWVWNDLVSRTSSLTVVVGRWVIDARGGFFGFVLGALLGNESCFACVFDGNKSLVLLSVEVDVLLSGAPVDEDRDDEKKETNGGEYETHALPEDVV